MLFNINKILAFAIFPIVSIVLPIVFQDTPYDTNSKRIKNNDFSITKTIIYPDSICQIRYYLIKNNTEYPINGKNAQLIYTSNLISHKIYITSSNGIVQKVEPTNNPKEIFHIPLPDNLTNEDYFSITVRYENQEKITDKLCLKVESKSDDAYSKFDDNNIELNELLNEDLKTYKLTKTIIIAESMALIYIILYLLQMLTNRILSIKRQQEKPNTETEEETTKML